MEPSLAAKLASLEEKIDAVYSSVEKTRKYFLIIIWVTVISIVLPIIGLLFALPTFLGQYASLLGGL